MYQCKAGPFWPALLFRNKISLSNKHPGRRLPFDALRVVAYARVSSKEQAEKELSIPAQLAVIRKYCQDKG
jgi:predicted site-specific integrase-resolvase